MDGPQSREGVDPAPTADAASPVVRIVAIEGLRAWLAWTVVAYHLLVVTNVDAHFGLARIANRFGTGAVHVFMMISGFVITGLLIQRKETWTGYIIRRAFRLFPAYWIALAIGVVAMYLEFAAFSQAGWASDPVYAADLASHATTIATVEAHPMQQAVLNVGLLQGLPPPMFFPEAGRSIVGPAWSLSVEWQFYLVAPLLFWMLRRQAWSLVLIGLTAASYVIQERGLLPGYLEGASLPNWLFLFVIGMLTRFAWPRMSGLDSFSWAIAAAVVMLGAMVCGMPAIPIWLGFILLISRSSGEGRFARAGPHLPYGVRIARGGVARGAVLLHLHPAQPDHIHRRLPDLAAASVHTYRGARYSRSGGDALDAARVASPVPVCRNADDQARRPARRATTAGRHDCDRPGRRNQPAGVVAPTSSRSSYFSKGSRTRMTSSRSGLVLRSATGLPTSSSRRRTYLTASPGSWLQERAPRVESFQPLMVS